MLLSDKKNFTINRERKNKLRTKYRNTQQKKKYFYIIDSTKINFFLFLYNRKCQEFLGFN